MSPRKGVGERRCKKKGRGGGMHRGKNVGGGVEGDTEL